MKTTDEGLYGFLVRRYSDYLDMRGYAVIECEILGSPDEVFDELINSFKEQLENAGDAPLSEKEWSTVREKIKKHVEPDCWTFDPNDIEELKDVTVPVSIKVNRVRLSDELVRQVINVYSSQQSALSDALLHSLEEVCDLCNGLSLDRREDCDSCSFWAYRKLLASPMSNTPNEHL